jgi:hypothetical protein
MLFKNISSKRIDAYGYAWVPGGSVDVKEDSLVKKFSLYPNLSSIVQPMCDPATQDVSFELLKVQAIGLGLKTDGRWSSQRLKLEVSKYLNNDQAN